MVKISLISSLEKVYKTDALPLELLKNFSMLKNERKSFQIAICTDSDSKGKICIDTDVENLNLYSVEYIPSDFPIDENNTDDYYRLSEDGLYPDLLLPINTEEVELKNGLNVFWVEISSSKVGIHDINISLSIGNDRIKAPVLNVEVINAALDFGSFIYTNWFHSDCLMSYYKIEAFSEEYWRIVKNYAKTATNHGMNCILTPIFTPPLDTAVGGERPTVQLVDVSLNGGVYSFGFEKLDRWIDTMTDIGIQYFELSHLFTQWGAKAVPKIMAAVDGKYEKIFGWETSSDSEEYAEFLTAFSRELIAYIDKKGIKNKILLHVSDEPNKTMIEPYSKASNLINSLFEDYKIIDALSDIEFYELELIKNPIPANSAINAFLGKVDDLWTYYCCAQTKSYVSNRFFCHPSLRNRILGYQLFKYDIKGFLHWGYDFYYTRFSVREVDPYKETSAGKSFPSGDSFVVYPALDGTPYVSLRLKVFYDALQDMAALNTLSRLVGKEMALKIIDGDNALTFENYPHSEKWFLDTREKINSEIKNSIINNGVTSI